MESFGPHSAPDSSNLPKPLLRETRKTVRHKVHTPAYASLQQNINDTVLDLCEILDISEGGALLQTPMGWQLGTALDLMLDFSETQTKLHTRGEVVWSDAAGRVGVRFPELNEEARAQLQQWLFLNVMVAAANHEVGVAPPAPERLLPAAVEMVEELEPEFVEPTRSDYTSTLAALAAVQREVDAVGVDVQAALQILVARAQSLTRASGAAIALAEGSQIVCRASSGAAPSLGAVLEANSGLSGRCLQTGLLQRCDDAERDLRVDRESCRELNIRSILAVPVRRGDAVLGLVEVFSPRSYAFGELEASVIQRFSESILALMNRAGRSSAAATPALAATTTVAVPGAALATQQLILPASRVQYAAPVILPEPEEIGFLERHLTVFVGAAVLILAALAYVLVPMLASHVKASRSEPETATAQAAEVAPAELGPPVYATIERIRELADKGDPSAQYTLGARYATGEDVPQDYATAARWFQRAAEQGLVIAQDTLGNYYSAGRGVARNLNEAYYWSVLAELGGNEASRLRVQVLVNQLTPEQARSIQRSAGDFFGLHPPREKLEVR
jgi:TPR repeat protein